MQLQGMQLAVCIEGQIPSKKIENHATSTEHSS